MQYDKMKFSVGLFIISLFFTTAVFLYLILEAKGTFNKRYSYHFNTSSATSFTIGMPLKISGFNIGTIDDIELQSNGSVDMTFSVNEKDKKWISIGAVLVLRKPLIGSPHIEIYAPLGNIPLEEDSVLELIMSDDINDMILKLEPILKRAMSIIVSVDILTKKLAGDDSDLLKTLKNINDFTKKLADNNSLLTSLTGNQESTQSIIDSLHETTKIMKDVKKITDDMSNITASLDTKIVDSTSDSLNEVNLILKDIKKKLESLDGVVNSVGTYDKDLLELKEQMSVGLQKSNQIMDKVDALMQDDTNSEIMLP